MRRALRILPASYAYLACLAALAAAGFLAIPRQDFAASFLYFRDYVGSSWYTGHLWSLSIEEQFYLVWPASLVLLGRRAGLIMAASTLPISAILRVYQPGAHTFGANMDSIACGCLLAGAWERIGGFARWQSFTASPFFWLLPVGILASNKVRAMSGVGPAVALGFSNLLIAAVVERFVRQSRTPTGRLLNCRLFVAVGALSYSLYLWQEPWMYAGGQSWMQTIPVNVVLAILCATVSYYCIEQPFRRYGKRWRTTNTSICRAYQPNPSDPGTGFE
jgi:peptidoglycan/LPS O-acetylase OafA/YrhL